MTKIVWVSMCTWQSCFEEDDRNIEVWAKKPLSNSAGSFYTEDESYPIMGTYLGDFRDLTGLTIQPGECKELLISIEEVLRG